MTNLNKEAMANAYKPGRVVLSEQEQILIKRRADLLGPSYRLMYDRPLQFVRGEGVWLYDSRGKAYLDAYNNVASLGHCHPRVVEAITRQVNILATNTRYLDESLLDYAEDLIATFPPQLQHLMFTCSGSEANDLAYRIAKTYTEATGVIVTETAYHGITDAVSQFSPSLGSGMELGSHVKTIPAPLTHGRIEDAALAFANSVERAIGELLAVGMAPAMLIVDSLFTSDGICARENLLAPAVDLIRQAGGIFVADEVQSGFGRSGSQMWGFQRHGVVPDLVTMGKPMGNGQPVAGVVANPSVVEAFGQKMRYFNTFGGNAVSCAAASAVLKTLEEEELLTNATDIGTYITKQLQTLRDKFDCIEDIRSSGLMFGVEIVSQQTPDPQLTARIVNGMRDRGVLISSCGAHHNILKIRPPLIFTKQNADRLIEALDNSLRGLS